MRSWSFDFQRTGQTLYAKNPQSVTPRSLRITQAHDCNGGARMLLWPLDEELNIEIADFDLPDIHPCRASAWAQRPSARREPASISL
jgi:hypothetical protein